MSRQRLDLHRSGMFGVCALLSTSRSEQGSSSNTTPSSACDAGSSKRGDKRCVDCQLGATPQRQAIGDDFYAAVVLATRVHIQVSDGRVPGDRRPSFSANARSNTLETAAPRLRQNAGARARSEVVAARIEVCMATASGRSKWQGQARSAQQDGSGGEDTRSMRPCLRVQQGRRGSVGLTKESSTAWDAARCHPRMRVKRRVLFELGRRLSMQ